MVWRPQHAYFKNHQADNHLDLQEHNHAHDLLFLSNQGNSTTFLSVTYEIPITFPLSQRNLV